MVAHLVKKKLPAVVEPEFYYRFYKVMVLRVSHLALRSIYHSLLYQPTMHTYDDV